MLKIAICDDNLDELSEMAILIEKYRNDRQLNCEYATFNNGLDVISLIQKGKYFDVYCLDIVMPGYSGIELSKEIRKYDKKSSIVFFTSSPEFALESYSVKAINYILKPVTQEKFFFTLDDVLERTEKDIEKSIIIKSNQGIQKILLSNLIYVEATDRKSLYYCTNDKIYECFLPFSKICENLMLLDSFVQPHRSYVVNMRYFDTIHDNEILLSNKVHIPISRRNIKEIKDKYLEFQMEE